MSFLHSTWYVKSCLVLYRNWSEQNEFVRLIHRVLSFQKDENRINITPEETITLSSELTHTYIEIQPYSNTLWFPTTLTFTLISNSKEKEEDRLRTSPHLQTCHCRYWATQWTSINNCNTGRGQIVFTSAQWVSLNVSVPFLSFRWRKNVEDSSHTGHVILTHMNYMPLDLFITAKHTHIKNKQKM